MATGTQPHIHHAGNSNTHWIKRHGDLGDWTSDGSWREGESNRYYTTLSHHQKRGKRKLTYTGVSGINYKGRCIIDGRSTLTLSKTHVCESGSSEQDHRSQGWERVCEIHKRTSKETLVALCVRALLGLPLHVTWKWTTRKLAEWTTNTRVCYPLGEPGVLGLGWGHHGRQNNKAEPLRKPNFLISGTLCLTTLRMHSCFILCQVYMHTILLILYQRNREAFLMRKLQGGLLLMGFGI